jgi:hypothetical protein
LVLDGPSTDHYTAEALACRRFEIVVSGPGGHSWSDFGTANPIHALSRAVAAFTDTYAPRVAAGHAGRFSFNFGVVDGGTTVNAIPSSARAKVDLRSQDPALLEALSVELAAALEEALLTENERATGGRVTAKRKEAGNRPGGHLPDSARWTRRWGCIRLPIAPRPTPTSRFRWACRRSPSVPEARAAALTRRPSGTAPRAAKPVCGAFSICSD